MADASELNCIRLKDPFKALGHALSLLAKVDPYARYPFGSLVRTVFGQIQRGHYVLTLEGRAVVGYGGWALCSPETAAAWVEGGSVPAYEDCLDGPCPVLVTFHSKSRAATFRQIRHMREIYPGTRVYFRRDYAARWRTASVANVTPGRAE